MRYEDKMTDYEKEFFDNETLHDLGIRLYKQSECLEDMIDKLGIDYFKWFIPYYINRVNDEVFNAKNEKINKTEKELKDIIEVLNMNKDMFKDDYFEDVVGMLNKVINDLSK